MVVPLLSVVVPVYNVKEYLQTCVVSIRKSSYQNIEIILIDDGSCDGSAALCDEMREADDRIRVVHQCNGGLSDARNKGIKLSKGKYITFVDSDDFVCPNFFVDAISFAERELADIVQLSNIKCSEDDTLDFLQTVSLPNSTDYSILDNSEAMKQLLKSRGKLKTTAWGKVYLRSIFEEISFPVGKYHEDVWTIYRCVAKARKVVSSDYVGYVYRQREGSITNLQFSRKHLDSIYGSLERNEFIKQHYPECRKLSYAKTIYACNVNLCRMVSSSNRNSDYISEIQSIYRKYGLYYLIQGFDLKKKLFVALAMIDVRTIYFLGSCGSTRVKKFIIG